MSAHVVEGLYSQDKLLPDTADKLGELRDSSDIARDFDALRERMDEDGYLFLRGYLDRDEVLSARREMLERVAAEGGLAPGAPLMEGVLDEGVSVQFQPERTRNSVALKRLLFDGRMMGFFAGFLEGEVRHFDYIWLRSVPPGKGTAPHGDSVFMNRGTLRLFTAWTPLGEIDRRLGGLIVLEGSHTLDNIRNDYGQRDVDTYCDDDPDAEDYRTTGRQAWNGKLSDDPVALRDQLGGRWLTADYQPGDLLVFTMYTLHASLDNQTANRLRLSTDTRYQLASEPVDERWVGEHPIAHGPGAKKEIIC
jgi:ectoine hydroxylase-related dioxygenase (phytanoyl-CoA dioxygenase family)